MANRALSLYSDAFGKSLAASVRGVEAVLDTVFGVGARGATRNVVVNAQEANEKQRIVADLERRIQIFDSLVATSVGETIAIEPATDEQMADRAPTNTVDMEAWRITQDQHAREEAKARHPSSLVLV